MRPQASICVILARRPVWLPAVGCTSAAKAGIASDIALPCGSAAPLLHPARRVRRCRALKLVSTAKLVGSLDHKLANLQHADLPAGACSAARDLILRRNARARLAGIPDLQGSISRCQRALAELRHPDRSSEACSAPSEPRGRWHAPSKFATMANASCGAMGLPGAQQGRLHTAAYPGLGAPQSRHVRGGPGSVGRVQPSRARRLSRRFCT